MTNHHVNSPHLVPVHPESALSEGVGNPPAEWMPLDEIAHAWGSFGAATRDMQGWLATSDAFAALAMESEANQHTAVLLALATRSAGSREAASAAINALSDVLARWQMALLWLDHLRHHPAVPNEDEEAAARVSDLVARSRWHLLRVSRLQARLREEWMQQALWPSSQEQPQQEEAE